jgi:2-polyprenyl-6-methoxyphenol hydroxylase-like FAD-dependent oxidoreductase
MGRTVLVSGASIAGPVVAYWLARAGFTPTVVERTPAVRGGTGGHAVDLFGASVDVVEWMGLLPAVRAARTRTESIRFVRPGRRPVDVGLAGLVEGLTDDRHVEVMRGELAELFHRAVRDDVEHLFGDSVRTLHDDGDGVDVTFDHAPPRRFDLVVGADGLHSLVRRLTFGDDAAHRHHLGGYLAAFTLPGDGMVPGQMVTHLAVDRLVGTYPVWQTGAARALFLFRRSTELRFDHRDVDEQRRLLREVYADATDEVARLVAAADDAADFYLDAISQIRLDTWSRGRVGLVGDAGYSPGPAVGGGTTTAVIGAYVLAHRLATCPDHRSAFRAYQDDLRDLVLRSRALGPSVMRTIVPRSRARVALVPSLTKLVVSMPAGLRRRLLAAGNRPVRELGRITLPGPDAWAGAARRA